RPPLPAPPGGAARMPGSPPHLPPPMQLPPSPPSPPQIAREQTAPKAAQPEPALIRMLKQEGEDKELAVGPRQVLLDRFSELSRFGPLRPKEERTDPLQAFIVLLDKRAQDKTGPVAVERAYREVAPGRDI